MKITKAMVVEILRNLFGVGSTVVLAEAILRAYTTNKSTVDERLAKIDAARENLTEALQAMEDLHQQAAENKRQLDALNQEIDSTSQERDIASKQLNALKVMAQLDAESIRKAFGFPTRKQRVLGVLISFVLGFIASLAASWVWSIFS